MKKTVTFLLLIAVTLSLNAQTSSTTLKAQIDTDIVNKVGSKTISKLDVGNNMKDIVDYTDQQDLIKVDKISGSRLVNASEIIKLSDLSGVNTGDQFLSVKTVKTTITQAQILQLYTTPITILSSTTAGVAKIPLNILCKRNGSGSNYTIATNQFALKANSSGATFSMSLFNTILTSTDAVSYVNLSYNAAGFQIANGVDNEIYKLACYSSNPTGGTGSMDVYVTYIEIIL